MPLRDLWTPFAAKALFPLHERLKGHDTVRVRREMEASQWLAPDALRALQRDRLGRLLRRAAGSVPYYRDLFADLGLQPDDVDSPEKLGRLPLLDKAIIRAQGERMKAEDAEGLSPFNTGGSTGEPLTFWLSRERVTHDVAAKWRATRWWGVDIGDPEIVLWGSPIELGTQDRIKAVRDRLLRSRLLPAFAMSAELMDEFLSIIRRTRPKMLFGYPSALALLATRAEQRRLSLAGSGIRVAFVTGERLYPEQSEIITRIFGCRVANGYGGRDAGFIAHECPQGGLHLTAEDVVVETVDALGAPVPAGEPGEIVITHMATGDAPFIRYRTGDVGVLDDRTCACGRTLPLLREVQGRSTDFVMARDGTMMHGLSLIYVLREQPGVKQFKIVQETPDHTRVLVVPGEAWTPSVQDAVRTGLQQRLGSTVNVDVQVIDEIPPEKSGKYRYVVSHCA